MLNACAIDLKGLFSDGNLRDDDSLTYKAYVADNDDIRVKETATGVEIMCCRPSEISGFCTTPPEGVG